jgi:hypothetical protein
MDDGDGALTMELQARKIAENATIYKGSAPCPTCGVIIDPVQFLYNKGHCTSCVSQRAERRVKGKMA